MVVLCLVTQSCLTLCEPTNCSSPGSSVHGDSPGKNTGMGCHSLLQRIFPTLGSNPGLPHCRQILYHLSHKGSPILSLRAVKISSNINTPTQINLRNFAFSITKEGEISEYLTWVYWGNINKIFSRPRKSL